MENEIIKGEESKEVAHEEVHHHEATIEATHHEAIKEVKPKTKKLVWLKKFFTVKKIVIIVIIIAVIGLGFYLKNILIAATVNGTIVSRFEVIKSLEKQSGKVALDSIINERLINMEADNRKITVSDDEVKTEFTKIEDQLKTQGTTLEAALAENGLTRDEITKRIITQKKLEKMLADKINVTEADIDKYIKDSGATIPKGQEAVARASIKEQLVSTKLSEESKKFVDELTAKANIKYFFKY